MITNTAELLLEFPILVTLGKWTLVLSMALAADAALRRQHPRLRQLLWRGVLMGSLWLAATHVLPIPGPRIAIFDAVTSGRNLDPSADSHAVPTISTTTSVAASPESHGTSPGTTDRLKAVSDHQVATSSVFDGFTISSRLLLVLWVAGFLVCGARLIASHVRLARHVRSGEPASGRVRTLVAELPQTGRRNFQPHLIEVPGNISPFACGLVRRCIVLPKPLLERVGDDDLRVLLAHELAHLRRDDPLWCTAWSWLTALGWFHPLAWWAARSHALACELESDRAAAETTDSWPSYRTALSRIVLNVVGTPTREFSAARHATSHLGHRLDSLDRGRPAPWSAARLTLAGTLLTVGLAFTAGCHLTSKSTDEASSKSPAPLEFATVAVRVVDDHGLPVVGAKVRPFGLRVRGDEASAYGWDPARFGPKDPVTTSADGVAQVRYPVVAMPEERLVTTKILLTVDHPEFSRVVNQGYAVHGSTAVIQLRRGAQLRVAGYFGEPDNRIRALLPLLSAECVSCNDWTTNTDGSLSITGLVPGPHLLRLSGQRPSGEYVHGDAMEIQLEAGHELRLDLELKSGARLEGRLDPRVPRPIRDGRVLVAARPPQLPALTVPEDLGVLTDKYGEIARWQAWRPIAEDGTFVFESLPFGDVDLIVLGDGFVSAPGGVPYNRDRTGGGLINTKPIGVPQSFTLKDAVTQIEVPTEPTARLELQVRTRAGKPIENAEVQISPNIIRFPGSIFGEMNHPSEAAFGAANTLEVNGYAGRTDRDGKVVFENVPAFARGLDVTHPEMVIPLSPAYHDRWVRFSLTPGKATKLDLTMIPKGVDFAGAK
ncbi:MAG: M48 family metalloprotease [Verrucomicrobiales bacterium]|nr:M48 family metalloprotease [Verrucomicrobiales bacterium]